MSVYGTVPFFRKLIYLSNEFRLLSEQFLKLFFKTIGVVVDCLQSFSKSVTSLSGKVEYIGPLLLILSDEAASYRSSTIGIEMFAQNKKSDDGTVAYHEYRHSRKLSRNRIAAMDDVKDRNPVDSQNRSPLKHNRAGLYEKGDYNQ